MTIVKTLDDLAQWCRDNICPKVSLKLPNDEDTRAATQYVTPQAFVLYMPAKDRLPPNVPAPIPSICVQLVEGTDQLVGRRRRFKVRFCLSCWNPGQKEADKLRPREDAEAMFGLSYYLSNQAGTAFNRSGEGWRDVWTFLDVALHTIENTEFFAGMRLVKEDGITYGPFTEDGAIWDYYPYWFSWIAMTLESGIPSGTPETYRDLL